MLGNATPTGVRRVLVALLVAIGMTGFAAHASASASDVTITPDTLDYGHVFVDERSRLTHTLANDGPDGVELSFRPVEIHGPGFFAWNATTCATGPNGGFLVPANSTCEVEMEFAPEGSGTVEWTVDWMDIVTGESAGQTRWVGEGVDCSVSGTLVRDLAGFAGVPALEQLAMPVCNSGL